MHPTDQAIELPWWRQKRSKVIAAVIVIVVVGLIAFIALRGAGERSLRVPESQLTIGTIEQGVFRDVVPLRGTVQPKEILYLDAVEGGQVQEVLVEPGDRVTKGQPLMRFRNAQLELDVLNNGGRLIEAVTQLQTFETQIENNRATNQKALTEIQAEITQLESRLSRIDPLVARGFFPRGEAELLRKQLTSYRELEVVQITTNRRQEALRREQLPRIQVSQKTLQASLAATQDQLNSLMVRAPVTGTVTQLDLKIGQNRNRGERLAEINTDAGYKISAKIDEFYRTRIQAGQTGTVRINEESYELKVSRILPEVSNGMIMIELDFVGRTPSSLTLGAAVDGELTLGSDRRAVVLSTGAFLESWDGSSLFVLNESGSAAIKSLVGIGRRSNRQVEILNGLKPGTRVIISDYSTYDRIDYIDIQR